VQKKRGANHGCRRDPWKNVIIHRTRSLGRNVRGHQSQTCERTRRVPDKLM
jgi:hypothetical protein